MGYIYFCFKVLFWFVEKPRGTRDFNKENILLSSYNPQDRYRRKAADRIAGVLTVVALVGVSFGTGFWLGHKNAGYQEGVLRKQVDALNAIQVQLQDTITELRAETQTAIARYDQVQKLYNETVPEGPMQDLVSLLRRQIDEGRDPERLSFLIRSARPPRNCSAPKTRRFIVSTPNYKGAASKVAIADGALVVMGRGASAKDAEGRPEAWYDQSKKVSLDFITLGGEKEAKAGVMPIHHSVVIADREYRVTVTGGARSFAKVTYDSCDYP